MAENRTDLTQLFERVAAIRDRTAEEAEPSRKSLDEINEQAVRPSQDNLQAFNSRVRAYPAEKDALLDEAAALEISGENPARLQEVNERLAEIEQEQRLEDRKRSYLEKAVKKASAEASAPKDKVAKLEALEALKVELELYEAAVAASKARQDAMRKHKSVRRRAQENNGKDSVGSDALEELGLGRVRYGKTDIITDGWFRAIVEATRELVEHFNSPARQQ